ncbi:hypothetical protein ACFFX0_03775 [Citricoccus parietis]|uniref:Uncharacterized protein n=1 Tax=Citricoccus parietis TaxID=592307 RepID=A0ABV5FUI9_9MICC
MHGRRGPAPGPAGPSARPSSWTRKPARRGRPHRRCPPPPCVGWWPPRTRTAGRSWPPRRSARPRGSRQRRLGPVRRASWPSGCPGGDGWSARSRPR